MQIKDKALACARLSANSDKAGTELTTVLDKWFEKHFVKGVSLKALQSLDATDALATFESVIALRSEADLIAVMRKVDPQNVTVLSKSRADMMLHIRALASGAASPTAKPKPPKKPAPAKAAKPRKAGGFLANARQG